MKTQSRDIGIVFERRDSDHPWKDHSWHAVGIESESSTGPDAPAWREVGRGDGWVRYVSAPLTLQLFERETEGYKYNLSNDVPSIFLVWREDEDDPDGICPFHATVCPYEAQSYLDGDEEQIESIPMPREIAAWIADFVDLNHVDEPFYKRKRKPHSRRDAEPPHQGRAQYRGSVWRHG